MRRAVLYLLIILLLSWVAGCSPAPKKKERAYTPEYDKLLQDLIWQSHLSVVLVSLEEQHGKSRWVANTACSFPLCDSISHIFVVESSDPRLDLGKKKSPCGYGYVLIMSEDAKSYWEAIKRNRRGD